jgi:hypothetical protein
MEVLHLLKPELLFFIQDYAPCHLPWLSKRREFPLAFLRAEGYGSFVSETEVAVSLLFAQNISVQHVHYTTLLYRLYFTWLLKQKGLQCLHFTITFSMVFCTLKQQDALQEQFCSDPFWQHPEERKLFSVFIKDGQTSELRPDDIVFQCVE